METATLTVEESFNNYVQAKKLKEKWGEMVTEEVRNGYLMGCLDMLDKLADETNIDLIQKYLKEIRLSYL